MGAGLSRTLGLSSGRAGQEEDSGAGAHTYRYPTKNGGPYFAGHFIMGGEKFESPSPESFLFGENADLNFLGSRPVAFPYPPPQANEPTKTLRGLINIRRDSVHLVQVGGVRTKPTAVPSSAEAASADGDENSNGGGSASTGSGVTPLSQPDPPRYNLRFTFDCDVSCAVTVYYFCNEETHASGVSYSTKRADLASDTYVYQRGATQIFDQPAHIFRPSKCIKELTCVPGETADYKIPLAIHCVSLEGDGPRQSHSTLAALDLQEDGGVVIKSIKQKLFVDGLSYFLQEIYGLENKAPDARPLPEEDDVDDCGAECVVCMCDMRDTIILPCRHLCLCNACADSLRYQANNCPICRAPFRALLQIRAVQKVNQVTHPALADPDIAQDGIPNGYQCVSLMEALNGPVPAAPVPQATVSIQTQATEKKKRKSRSSKKSRTASSAAAAPATPSREDVPGTSGRTEVDAAVDPSSSSSDIRASDVAATKEEEEGDVGSSNTRLTSSQISIKIVNETKGASSEGGATTTLVVDATSSSSETPLGSSSKLSVDVVEEELANMRSPAEAAKEEEEGEAATSAETKDDETVVVNLRDGSSKRRASRVSIPGTPTSIASVRSSQDSSSSSSSTKQLLPSSSASTARAGTASSTGGSVVVRVKAEEEGSTEVTQEEEGESTA